MNNTIILDSAEQIIQYIKNAEKMTPAKLFATGQLIQKPEHLHAYQAGETVVLIGPLQHIQTVLAENNLTNLYLEVLARNSAIPLLDISNIAARIEPGAIIREHVEIGADAVIMMGAVINIGAKIGAKTMIDMNVVVGGRAEIGQSCHIGAGSVVAGVIEPASATPVVIEDGVVVGANAVIIEGVHVGQGAVIGAGSIVTTDVPAGSVVVGNPAKIIKTVDEQTKSKTEIIEDLR